VLTNVEVGIFMSLNKESAASFIKQCRRVLHVSKKPDRIEYNNVAKITGIGIIIIGVIGFIISIIAQLLGKL
jgi:protein transport protein SEC61 subunit gamma and related proteins